MIEYDVSQSGVGAILTWEGKPLAFISQGFLLQHKWGHYLGGKFVIKTDQESIKYLLQHKPQTHYRRNLIKLLGLNYIIQ